MAPISAVTAGLLLLTFWVSTPAWAQMRCGNALVQEGDLKVQILIQCGEPLFIEEVYHCLPHGYGCGIVERWTYDLGPTKMLRILTFRNGKLAQIELADRP